MRRRRCCEAILFATSARIDRFVWIVPYHTYDNDREFIYTKSGLTSYSCWLLFDRLAWCDAGVGAPVLVLVFVQVMPWTGGRRIVL